MSLWKLSSTISLAKMTENTFENSELISKSQRKRETQEFRILAEKLVQLTDEQLSPLSNTALTSAIHEYRKITKGNARKRLISYIGKLLRGIEIDDISNLIARYDASSKIHARQFHQLEQWREQLISGDYGAMDEIAALHPVMDRQQLKQLTRKAIQERQKLINDQLKGAPVQYRKLFQYLKTLVDSASH